MPPELQAFLELFFMLVCDPRTGVLIGLLIIAAITDYRSYRIPNWLTVGGIVFALLYRSLFERTFASGFLDSIGGLSVGFAIMLPLYLLKVMGAGDVKLMAMVGAFLGVDDTLHAVLYTFIVGGVAAIGFAMFKGAFLRMVANVRHVVQKMLISTSLGFKPDGSMGAGSSVGRLPYGVSITVGTVGFMLARQFGLA